MGFERGIRTALLAPDEALAHPYSDAERSIVERVRSRAIAGTADEVATRLDELARRFELDELVIVTWTFDAAPRHRSYELLATAFGLG